jgi:hypothetical protein
MRTLSLISANLFSLALHAQMPEEKLVPLSVCELIANRNDHNGRIISVRGEVKGGPHGEWMTASTDCRYQLISRGETWPNIIFLSYPNNRSPLDEDHANFNIDWDSIHQAEETIKRGGYKPGVDRLIETYVGRFVTYSDLDKRVNPGVPGAHKLGFGPVGLDAPAKLLIRNARDAIVLRGLLP